MSLSLKEVLDVAALARIGIDEDEARAVQGELNNIFELIGRMQKVDTEGIEPMTHAQGLALRLREDAVTESNQREANQRSAPAVEDGLFLVPKVIE